MAAGHSSFQKPDEHFILSAAEHWGVPREGCRSTGAHTPPQGTEAAGLCHQKGYRHCSAHQAGADQEVTDRKASKGMTAHMGRCVITREVPPKPVIPLRLQGHQFVDQDTTNSLHGVHLEASHHAARLHAPIPQLPTMGSTRVSRGTLQVGLHLKIRVSLDESHRCLKGSRATPESEPRWMLQDTSSHLNILIKLQPVSPLFSTSHPGSLPCTSPSTQRLPLQLP